MVERSEFDKPRPGETLEEYLKRHNAHRSEPGELEATNEATPAAELREQYTGAEESKDKK
jgi:hypothetical protein